MPSRKSFFPLLAPYLGTSNPFVTQYPSCYSPESDDDGPRDGRPDCPNRYQSILSSSYFVLINLIGEFPLVDRHNTAGRYIGVFTAVVRSISTCSTTWTMVVEDFSLHVRWSVVLP